MAAKAAIGLKGLKALYSIAGNFRGRKFSQMHEIEDFTNNILANQCYCPIFVNKNKTFRR